MYHVSAQGVDERMINVHYYYYSACKHDSSVKNKTKQKHMVRTLYDCNQLSEEVVSASSAVGPTLKFRPRYSAASVSVASTLYLSGDA